MSADTEPGNFSADCGYIPRFIGFGNLISRGFFMREMGRQRRTFDGLPKEAFGKESQESLLSRAAVDGWLSAKQLI